MDKNSVQPSSYVSNTSGGMSPMKLLLITLLLAFPALSQKVTAATKAEITAWLDAQDGIAPGDIDSIQYTDPDLWSLTHIDLNQNDGQTVKLFVNGQEITFGDALFVTQGAHIRIEGVLPSGVDDFFAGTVRGDIEAGSPPLALGITKFSCDKFDQTTRSPIFSVDLVSSQNTEYFYVSRWDKSTNTWKQWSDNVTMDGDFSQGEKHLSIPGYAFPMNVYGTQYFRIEEKEDGLGNVNVYKPVTSVKVPRGGEVVYGPNPAVEQCMLDYGPDIAGDIVVYGVLGGNLNLGTYTGTPMEFDVSTLPSGVYYVEVVESESKQSIPGTRVKISVVR